MLPTSWEVLGSEGDIQPRRGHEQSARLLYRCLLWLSLLEVAIAGIVAGIVAGGKLCN